MNFELEDDQETIRATVRDLLDTRVTSERRRAALALGAFDDQLWSELCELGWPGIATPEEHGGDGLGTLELALLCEELGRALAPVPFLPTVAAAVAIDGAGSAEQRARFLPALAAGTSRGAVGVLSDGVARMVIAAVGARPLVLLDEDRALITGARTHIEAAASIDVLRPYATVKPNGGSEPMPGTAQPVADRIEVLVAAELTGVAQRALELAVAFAGERHQFGRPIGSFQGVSHRCARMALETEKSRSLTRYAAWLADHDPSALPLAASAAKVAAATAAIRAASDSIQVHGGIGFTWEADLHFLLKRARASTLVLRSPAWHRRRIARLRTGTAHPPLPVTA